MPSNPPAQNGKFRQQKVEVNIINAHGLRHHKHTGTIGSKAQALEPKRQAFVAELPFVRTCRK